MTALPETEEEAAADDTPQSLDREALRLVEALLFASPEPLDEKAIAARLPAGTEVRPLLERLRADYAARGVVLVRVGPKWAFRTAPDLAFAFTKEAVAARRLTRAALETLAIIAYHQPVTRAEIEDIRGVAVSKSTFDALLDSGFIRLRGRRKTPGRPVVFGTTDRFLDHFGLETLKDLPGLDEMRATGLIEGRLPPGFAIPQPSDDAQLREDEEPIGDGEIDLGLAPRVEEEDGP